MRNARGVLLSILLSGLAALILPGCGRSNEAAADSKSAAEPAAQPAPAKPGVVALDPGAPELRQITVEPVRTVQMPADEVTAPAKIEANPNRVAHALLPAPGRVVRVLVKLGDAVAKGQPLVTVESSAVAESESGYIQAEAAVRQAELALAKAQADLGRLTDLFEHQAVAEKEVLAAQTTSALSKASVEQAQSAREQARRRLELLGLKAGKFHQQVTVPAPLAGKVLEISVVEGEFRNETNTPLLTIADLSRVWATSEVPESKIRYCKIGGMADLDLIAYPNETFRARVTRIADTVDAATRTIKVSAELENNRGRLRPEMFGTLRYADRLADIPWVPATAVVRVNDKDLVFVEEAKGRFAATSIQLGKPRDGGYAVEAGLSPGDRIVTKGSVYLKASL